MLYRHPSIIILFLLFILLPACKKEHSNSSGQGNLSFTINGINYSYMVVPSYDSISSGIFNNMLYNSTGFGAINQNTAAVIGINEILNLPALEGLDTGVYFSYNFDTACIFYGGHPGCHTFSMTFTNGSSGVIFESSSQDSSGRLYLTSFDTTNKLMSGYFSCQLMDDTAGTTFCNVTNGKFTNVPFYFVH